MNNLVTKDIEWEKLGYVSLGCAKNLVDTEGNVRLIEEIMAIRLQKT